MLEIKVVASPPVSHDGGEFILSLDWRAIAAKCDGIIISPYIWARRLNGYSHWYHGWDCASGCIWNPRAIREVTHLNA